MVKSIINNDVFQIVDGTAAVTIDDANTVQLYISSDGTNFTPKGDAITTPETITIANAPQGLYCKLSGLTDGKKYTLIL